MDDDDPQKKYNNRKMIQQQPNEQWEDQNAKITATSFPRPSPCFGGKRPWEVESTADLRDIKGAV